MLPPSMKTWNCKFGFLLLYVSMVLAFVLIIIMLAVPHLGFIQRHVMRAEVENVRLFITYAHRLALATNQQQVITIDLARNRLEGAGRSYDLARGVHFGALPHIKGPPAAPDQLVTVPATFAKQSITCHVHGAIDAGTLYLVDQTNQWQYAVSVGVSPVTYIRTYYFDGSWKRCQ